MKVYGARASFAIMLALAVAACGDAGAPSPERTSAERTSAERTSAVDAPPQIPVSGPERPILAFGDSLLTGYRLESGESYPEMLEAALRARGINARIANAGVSGDTTAAALERLKFTLDSQTVKPELVIISLGGNDMLRGLPPEGTRANLDAMLTELGRRRIPVLLLGMLAAPNLGKDYAARFNPIYPTLAREHGVALVPFFMQPLMDRPDLVQQDRIHPTMPGVEAMVAATIDDVIEALPERK